MADVTGILSFIKQNLAQDERAAATARDLRQVAATRAVLRWHDETGCPECATDPDGCSLLRATASVWPDAIGYREYWQP
ncbi:hypothetical protein [Streptomyces sp. NPDC005799]|uniref:hypothetical protein n=1 Tax=Streptomyces sp. NPDC005799 TaxID=3154678 RepID=UPI0033C581DF